MRDAQYYGGSAEEAADSMRTMRLRQQAIENGFTVRHEQDAVVIIPNQATGSGVKTVGAVQPFLFSIPDPKAASRLRALGDKMTAQIEAKRNPATASQNWTRRRAGIVAGMQREADAMEQVQYTLYALADAHERGDIPSLLAGIKSKADVDTLMYHRTWPQWEDAQKRATRAGLTPDTIGEASRLLVEMANPPDRSQERRLRELEDKARGLVGLIPGFFPTPEPIARQMVQTAGVGPGMQVLEPSAGSGNIADVIRTMCPEADLSVIEWNVSLCDLLKVKGHLVIGSDFFEVSDRRWDRIIQNPPFENFQDIDHVRWAWEHLAEGGRLVSVMSESPFFRKDAKAAGFRDWLSALDHYVIDLEPGAFAASGTGVSAKIVVIDK